MFRCSRIVYSNKIKWRIYYGKCRYRFSSTYCRRIISRHAFFATCLKLGAIAIKAALAKINLNPADIHEIIMGQVLTAGAGQAPARQEAGLRRSFKFNSLFNYK